MGLKDKEYLYSYDSDECDLLNDFYIPVLKEAKEYRRIAGFFSSTCFAVAAQGIRGLIDNGGIMKLIISPRISKDDIEMMQLAYSDPEEAISKTMISTIEDIKDALDEDYVNAMGWMIANGFLDFRIAIVYDLNGNVMSAETIEEKGLFHIKTGIIKDCKNDIISFSGSINESVSGWVKNAEEFKVFQMWESGQSGYCLKDIERFDEYWAGERGNTKVYDIPDAVRKKLIKQSPDNINEIRCLSHYKYSTRYKKNENDKVLEGKIETGLDLYFYQEEAVNMWIDNEYKLLCEMATGTGKTRTAIACMNYALKKYENLLVVIVCPQNTLSLQWKKEIKSLEIYNGTIIIADSSNSKLWRKQMEECLLDITLGIKNNGIVLACSKTFCKNDFIKILSNYSNKVRYMLIGDEAHGLGALQTSRGLLDFYTLRLGLSATPSRWYDDYGTALLRVFFGNKSFEFTIYQALHTEKPGTGNAYLTPYIYHPIFINLNKDEVYAYEDESKKIMRAKRVKDKDEDARKRYERLLMARANIYKNAEMKYSALETILDKIKGDEDDTIIYVSNEQIDEVINILSERGIRSKKYTQKCGTKPLRKYRGKTERENIIEQFKDGSFHVLVAIKCLDEGIDIPSARRAIIMASSTNPREFIQRIGRVIRTDAGKENADIYDLIVVPDTKHISTDLLKFELEIFNKEQNRIFDISDNAINSVEVLSQIDKVLRGIHKWE